MHFGCWKADIDCITNRYLESAAEDNHSEACYLLSKILLDKEELDPGTVDMEKILK